jgi:hypothetical protein
MFKNLSKANCHVGMVTRILILVFTLQTSTLQTSIAFAQAPPNLKANNTDSGPSHPGAKPPVSSTLPPIKCPTKNLRKPIISPQSVGHHTVILTWTPPVGRAKIAGYCLYRSENQKIPSTIYACTDCQVVSELSIAGDGCVDDRVEDDKTYYYVVTAAASEMLISPTSNRATASIPKETAKPAAPVASSYPLCRKEPQTEKSNPKF